MFRESDCCKVGKYHDIFENSLGDVRVAEVHNNTIFRDRLFAVLVCDLTLTK